jgi:hypothetical protein
MKRADDDTEKRFLFPPKKNEKRGDFEARFMVDKEALRRFPEEKRRRVEARRMFKPFEKEAMLTVTLPDEDGVEKKAALTTSDEGHAHIVLLDHGSGEMTNGTTSYTNDHSHPWIMGEGGLITIGSANGHTHSVATVSKREFSTAARETAAEEGEALSDGSFPIKTKGDLKNAISSFGRAKNKKTAAGHIKRRAKALDATDLLPGEGALALSKAETGEEEGDAMPATQKKEPTAEERLTEMEVRLDRAEKFGKLTDVEKVFHDGLDEGKPQEEFLGKSVEDRSTQMREAEDSKETIFKSKDGTVYTSKDDPRVVALAKSNDLLAEKLAKSETVREVERLEKRAEKELGHLPGSVEHRAVLLKAVNAIPDENAREAALAAIRAGDTAMSKTFQMLGVTDGRTETNAEAQLETLAKAYSEKHTDLTQEQAYTKVLETEEGQRLYGEMTA